MTIAAVRPSIRARLAGATSRGGELGASRGAGSRGTAGNEWRVAGVPACFCAERCVTAAAPGGRAAGED